MRTLVVYYSRTGNSRQVAEEIATGLEADIEEIVDRRDRGGIIGGVKSSLDAVRKKETEIADPRKEPSDYDLVVVGTPVRASSMSPAIRTWLERFRGILSDVAFFLITSGGGVEKTFQEMAEVSETTPHETLAITVSEIKKDAWRGPTEAFVEELATFHKNHQESESE